MKRFIQLLLLIAACGCSLNAQIDTRLQGIEKELQDILEVTKSAGFAVAVVDKDKLIYAKGFGYRDYENKIPVDENTLFAIGSSSKAFTSAILGQLRDDDKLSLEDSPIKYIPQLEFYNDELNSGITIKDMMCHRTGIPRHDISWYMFPTQDRDELMARVKYQEPFTGLRKQWYYNNFMFLGQGVIAEKITGKTWEENIAERFFKPLRMDRSNATIQEMKDAQNASLGYTVINDEVTKMDYYDIAAMSPAGSINSSVKDMANWAITWINGGKFEGEQIIPEAYCIEAISPHMIVNNVGPNDEFPDIHLASYGYGWFILSYKGHYRVEHGGNIDGFSANVSFFPSDSIGIVVLSNQNGSAVPSHVRNTIAERMLDLDRTDWAARLRGDEDDDNEDDDEEEAQDMKPAIVENTSPSHNLQEYTGMYSNMGYGEFEIKNENDSLFAYLPLNTYYLKHVHYDVFEPLEKKKEGIDSTGFLKFNFMSNDVGDISGLKAKLEPALDQSIEFKRIPTAVEVDKVTLQKYEGSYELSGMEVKVYTKNEETLYLFVAGQPEYELIATGKHKFSFKSLEGFKVEFNEAEDGNIEAITLLQPNGTFKADRKK